MDLREIIEQAHMAGQHDAGVDAGYSNARAYCDGILEELAANGAKPTLREVLAEVEKRSFWDYVPGGAIRIEDLEDVLSEYFA